LRILLTGKNGQVGSALVATLPALGQVLALDRTQLDLARPDSIRAAMRHARPEIIVNAAAYTAVDQAEREETLAFSVNRDAAAILAEEAAARGALLVHFSTGYVFDGEKATPYVETDAPNPLNAYGRSKLAAEQAIQACGCRHLIFRTNWVYAATGKNFMLTVLRLARDRKPPGACVAMTNTARPLNSHDRARGRLAVRDNTLADPIHSRASIHMTARGRTELASTFARGVYSMAHPGPRLRSQASYRGAEYQAAARAGRSTRLLGQSEACGPTRASRCRRGRTGSRRYNYRPCVVVVVRSAHRCRPRFRPK
jgi:dTDP-4-dehydrorhamnose reductase